MSNLRELAYRVDPALWVREVLGVSPTPWQETFLRAPRGASLLALTARQMGKTTTAAWAIAHSMVFCPGSLSVIGCPAQRQSAEAVGRVHEVLVKAGAKFKSDNVYGLELENGSRVLALPSSDNSIRGLTVDAWIVADEAARLPEDLIAALRPMRARRPEARFAMLSTAWSRSDPFWTAWASDDPTWIRLQATVDSDPSLFKPEFLESERRALGEHVFKREYLGIPGGAEASPFTWELYERATNIHEPLAPPGPAFRPPPQPEAVPISNPVQAALRNGRITMSSSLDDPANWPLKIPIIARDVGRTNDRSTAVIGGNCPFAPRRLGIQRLVELPRGLYGSELANALAAIDRSYNGDALIVADLSNDATYAETLFNTFGPRVIGVHIGPHGDGTTFERRLVGNSAISVYAVGRTYLLELLLSELRSHQVRFADDAMSRRAYEQLAALEPEQKENRVIYKCPSGQHDLPVDAVQ